MRWRGYPSSSLPRDFRPKDLLQFNVNDSYLDSMEISKITQNVNVSVLNSEGCKNMRRIPNLSGLSSLKELWLRNSKNLIEIANSVGQLAKLETLNCLKQQGAIECGYYIIHFMFNIIESGCTKKFEKIFDNDCSYTVDDIDFIRDILAQQVLQE
ncbi:disease resistance protein RML1B-like [Neltuma alba]|uniref:disease resistance protein RML1B-like n=1 Tax=Neltuma alba TaxID=207710 RepID=UPI0010A43BDA|nr:disease resistance protein RML1B-like [Prosopis alba]